MYLSEDEMRRTDYLTETLQTEESSRKEIFIQMLRTLEHHGDCRYVYHRLAYVLFQDTLE